MHFGFNNPCFSYTIGSYARGYAPAGHVIESIDEDKDLGTIIHTSGKPSKQCATAA